MTFTHRLRSKRASGMAAAHMLHFAGDTFRSSADAAGVHDAWPAPVSLDDHQHPSTIGNARRAASMRPVLEEMLEDAKETASKVDRLLCK